jgi:hypothetical protein
MSRFTAYRRCGSILFNVVNAYISLIVIVALASGVRAQTPPDLASTSLSLEPAQVWEIPALGYGANAWSILRLTNNSDSAASLQVDVYCGAGNRMPLGPAFAVEPHKALDIRIDAQSVVAVLCWARVSVFSGMRGPGIQLRAFLETLNGNQLEDFDREPSLASGNSAWALPEPEIAGQQLYVLNASDKPTVLTFCVANKPEAKACQSKGANPVHRLANPRQAILVDVKKFRKKYLIAESSEPGRAIIQVFNDQPGHRRVYSSESSISFDTPQN